MTVTVYDDAILVSKRAGKKDQLIAGLAGDRLSAGGVRLVMTYMYIYMIQFTSKEKNK